MKAENKNTLQSVVELLAPMDWAEARVGIDNFSTGTPVVDVVFPKNNRYKVDFAEIKRALREHYIILHFCAPDGETITFWLSKNDVEFHQTGPNKRRATPILTQNLGRPKASRDSA